MPNTCLRLAAAAVACAATCVAAVSAGSRIVVAAHRRNYAADASARLQHGRGGDYRFARFQSSAAVKRAFDKCRPRSAFKAHDSDDGRSGAVCTTKLGGDWVLAESEQVAPDCTCEEVLRAYLDGRLQKTWSPDKVIDVCPWKRHLTKCQLLQFAVCLTHTVYCWVTGNYPWKLCLIEIWVMVNMLVLFGNFYLKSYSDAKKKKSDRAAAAQGNGNGNKKID